MSELTSPPRRKIIRYPSIPHIIEFASSSPASKPLLNRLHKSKHGETSCRSAGGHLRNCRFTQSFHVAITQLKFWEGMKLVEDAGVEYDMVVKLRLDMAFLSPLDLGQLWGLVRGSGGVVLHQCQNQTLADDHLLAGPLHTMIKAAQPERLNFIAEKDGFLLAEVG